MEDHAALSTFDKLKLPCAAREGSTDKFAFFEIGGKTADNFQTVYNLNMKIKSLSKALIFLDMVHVFHIIALTTIDQLQEKLAALFADQSVQQSAKLEQHDNEDDED